MESNAEMTSLAWVAVALAIVAIPALVVSDYRQFRPGRYIFKPAAAAAFLCLALAMGAFESSYGALVLTGLLFSALGDVLLMPEDRRCFLFGLLAFLCGHLFYAVAFFTNEFALPWMLLNGFAGLCLLIGSLRWLMPHLDSQWKPPVILYTLVITGMLLSAGLRASHPGALFIMAGAWGFALSDLAVARQRFVAPSPKNGIWGTPLYFVSQLLLAYSVSLVHS